MTDGREEKRVTNKEKQEKLLQQAQIFSRHLAQLGYVKVVRCKNCRHGKKAVSEFGMPEITCEFTDMVQDGEWYCPQGEV